MPLARVLIVDELENVDDKNILVSSRAEDHRLFVSVRDSGRGIPEENRGKLFTPFFTTIHQGKGAGPALCITRKIIRAHGGDITVTSPCEEWSTEFSIQLPPS